MQNIEEQKCCNLDCKIPIGLANPLNSPECGHQVCKECKLLAHTKIIN